ncbi:MULTISPECIES: cupin domain-containing protein [Microbacterium]|jgi:uncharacterized cupin superfamily protein|uniref:cupin domain-containing protein n=1 Tax=Microbacterium TaxID=33882 RepID=UPI0023DB9D63|nr:MULTISPECIES: cupin domain-containing protein [Microbacterium]MDF2045015.1 cupin domain-containing protein [Microbacterium sp. Kw_RZR3]MDF2917113.1 cupin [Microbacterium sp.]MDQ1075562.1 putative cupin superfamily protein [Microbacterium sp. SORGH_AS_0969]MDQ1115801.1 putative cupin superfamily protein [Microbacterium testaceum]
MIIDALPSDLALTSKGLVPDATSGDPEQFTAPIASGGGLRVGTWMCEPGEFPWSWTHAEMFHIIEGEGTLTDADGCVHVIAPGRVFFMEAGDTGTWVVTKTIRKSWVVPEQV